MLLRFRKQRAWRSTLSPKLVTQLLETQAAEQIGRHLIDGFCQSLDGKESTSGFVDAIPNGFIIEGRENVGF